MQQEAGLHPIEQRLDAVMTTLAIRTGTARVGHVGDVPCAGGCDRGDLAIGNGVAMADDHGSSPAR